MTNKQLSIILKLRDEASKRLKGFSGNMRRFANQVRKHWKAVSLVLLAVAAAMVKVMKQAVAYGVQLDEMAKQASITTEEFSRLAYAAEQEHASLETLTKIFPILTKYMEYSRMGMMTYKREFDKMGIGVTDATGKLKSTYHVFLEMADYYSKAEDKTKALAIAVTLLGRRGAEVIPLLRLGRKGIEELGDEAERLGVVMSQETAAKMKKFDDAMVRLKTALKGIGIKITEELIQPLEIFANRLDKVNWGEIGKGVAGIFSTLKIVAGIVVKIAYGLAMLKVTWELFVNKFAEMILTMKIQLGEFFVFIIDKLTKIYEKLPFIGEKIKAQFTTTINEIENSIEATKRLKEAFKQQGDAAVKELANLSNNLEGISDLLSNKIPASAKEGADKTVKALKGIVEQVDEGVKEAAKQFNAMEEFAKQSARNMQNAFSQFFFKAFTGELRSLQEIFVNFGKAVLQMISNILARLLLIKMFTAMAGPGGKIFGVAVGSLFHEGGMVRKHHGGFIRAHNGLSPDEVPIIAQTGEGILSRQGVRALGGSDNLRALNRGEQAGGGGVTININQVIQAWDAQDVWRNRKALSNAIADDIYNNGKIRSVIRSYT